MLLRCSFGAVKGGLPNLLLRPHDLGLAGQNKVVPLFGAGLIPGFDKGIGGSLLDGRDFLPVKGAASAVFKVQAMGEAPLFVSLHEGAAWRVRSRAWRGPTPARFDQ
jgi:hypothetical protein